MTIAVALWIIGSALFSLYVTRFGNYNETYGAAGAVVILLMWFLLSSYAVLIGAEINAETERQTKKDGGDEADTRQERHVPAIMPAAFVSAVTPYFRARIVTLYSFSPLRLMSNAALRGSGVESWLPGIFGNSSWEVLAYPGAPAAETLARLCIEGNTRASSRVSSYSLNPSEVPP